jgi:translation initiation factor 4E
MDPQPKKEAEQLAYEGLHPLEHEWVFWFDKRQSSNRRNRGEKEQFESNLMVVGSFATVEDFWRFYNHMAKPSQLPNNSNYHLFKKDIKPMWEDKANVNGGKWVINLKGQQRVLLDSCWENIVLSLIGETLDPGNEVTGCVCSIRKGGHKIAVWNRNKNDEDMIKLLGNKIKGLLEGMSSPKGDIVLSYQSHEDSMKTGTSYLIPDKYTLTI